MTTCSPVQGSPIQYFSEVKVLYLDICNFFMVVKVETEFCFSMYITQEHDEPILKHLLDIRVIFTGPDSNVDTTQYPQPTPMVCIGESFNHAVISADNIVNLACINQ